MGFKDLPVQPGLHVAPIPRCPEHGQMHLRVAQTSPDGANRLIYVCLGFDGEGCGYAVDPDGQERTRTGHAGRIDMERGR